MDIDNNFQKDQFDGPKLPNRTGRKILIRAVTITVMIVIVGIVIVFSSVKNKLSITKTPQKSIFTINTGIASTSGIKRILIPVGKDLYVLEGSIGKDLSRLLPYRNSPDVTEATIREAASWLEQGGYKEANNLIKPGERIVDPIGSLESKPVASGASATNSSLPAKTNYGDFNDVPLEKADELIQGALDKTRQDVARSSGGLKSFNQEEVEDKIYEGYENIYQAYNRGERPIRSIEPQFLSETSEQGMKSETLSTYDNQKVTAATLGTNPFKPEERAVLEIDLPPDQIQPRLTGTDGSYNNVVRLPDFIPPENIIVKSVPEGTFTREVQLPAPLSEVSKYLKPTAVAGAVAGTGVAATGEATASDQIIKDSSEMDQAGSLSQNEEQGLFSTNIPSESPGLFSNIYSKVSDTLAGIPEYFRQVPENTPDATPTYRDFLADMHSQAYLDEGGYTPPTLSNIAEDLGLYASIAVMGPVGEAAGAGLSSYFLTGSGIASRAGIWFLNQSVGMLSGMGVETLFNQAANKLESEKSLLEKAGQAQKTADDAYQAFKKDIDNGNSPDPEKLRDWYSKKAEADRLTEEARQKAQEEYAANRDSQTAQSTETPAPQADGEQKNPELSLMGAGEASDTLAQNKQEDPYVSPPNQAPGMLASGSDTMTDISPSPLGQATQQAIDRPDASAPEFQTSGTAAVEEIMRTLNGPQQVENKGIWERAKDWMYEKATGAWDGFKGLLGGNNKEMKQAGDATGGTAEDLQNSLKPSDPSGRIAYPESDVTSDASSIESQALKQQSQNGSRMGENDVLAPGESSFWDTYIKEPATKIYDWLVPSGDRGDSEYSSGGDRSKSAQVVSPVSQISQPGSSGESPTSSTPPLAQTPYTQTQRDNTVELPDRSKTVTGNGTGESPYDLKDDQEGNTLMDRIYEFDETTGEVKLKDDYENTLKDYKGVVKLPSKERFLDYKVKTGVIDEKEKEKFLAKGKDIVMPNGATIQESKTNRNYTTDENPDPKNPSEIKNKINPDDAYLVN